MFTPREIATILGALLFWKEEMTPHDPQIAQPYFKHFKLSHLKPLSAPEIERLCRRLRRQLPKPPREPT